MENNQLKARILESIIKKIGIENLDNDYSLYYDVPLFSSYDDEGSGLQLDSIDSLEIIIAIKEEFNVKIGSDDMEVLRTISSIADFIKSNEKN